MIPRLDGPICHTASRGLWHMLPGAHYWVERPKASECCLCGQSYFPDGIWTLRTAAEFKMS